MNARKAIFILGGVVVLLVCAVVAVSLFYLARLESEKNSLKTSAARDARWKKKEAGDQLHQSQSESETVTEDLKELEQLETKADAVS